MTRRPGVLWGAEIPLGWAPAIPPLKGRVTVTGSLPVSPAMASLNSAAAAANCGDSPLIHREETAVLHSAALSAESLSYLSHSR